MNHYVQVRQEYLVSQTHTSSIQACSILITGIPPQYLSELSLTCLFNYLPGGVRQVWINRDLKDMPELYERRVKACDLLESAETSLLNIAVKCHEEQKKAANAGDKERSSAGGPEASRKALLEELVPREKRPSHRLPLFSWMPFSVPFAGKKVDTVEWARDQVHELTTQLEQRREILAKDITRTSAAEKLMPLVGTVPVVDFSDQTYRPSNAAFILFNKQIAAHMAAQTIIHNQPYRMSVSQRYIDVAPDDVIWENLTMNPFDGRLWTALSWTAFSWTATIGLVLLWAIPRQSHPNRNNDETSDLVLK